MDVQIDCLHKQMEENYNKWKSELPYNVLVIYNVSKLSEVIPSELSIKLNPSQTEPFDPIFSLAWKNAAAQNYLPMRISIRAEGMAKIDWNWSQKTMTQSSVC